MQGSGRGTPQLPLFALVMHIKHFAPCSILAASLSPARRAGSMARHMTSHSCPLQAPQCHGSNEMVTRAQGQQTQALHKRQLGNGKFKVLGMAYS